jgi:hypothetical protein
MHGVAQRIVPALVVLACLQSGLAGACAILTKEQAAEVGRKNIEEAKAETLKLRDQADLIFTGRLSRLTFEQETVDKRRLQHHQAVFDVHQEIKGHYPQGQALQFTTYKDRIWVGCKSEFWQVPKENGEGELYLVYALDGKILRTNHIPPDEQTLSAREEIRFISGQQ